MSFAGLGVFAQDSAGSKNSTTTSKKADKKAEKKQRINAIIKQEEEGNITFRKQSVFGLQLRTNGYGAFYEMGRRKSARMANIYTAEITEIKNRKEEKIGGAENFFSNSYVYGKINNFYQFKLGYGQQYILGQKGNKNGVAIIASLQGGLTLGFLKPYYLDVVDSTGQSKSITYEQDSVTFLDRGSIIGGGGFTKGWSNVKLKPGIFLKAGLRFDFGRYNESVQALEIGMSVEAYAQEIPMIVYNDPQRLFFQGHIAFVFGRRK